MTDLSIPISPELLDQIADQVAERLAERQAPGPEDGWLRGAERIGAYIDAPASRVYALASAESIPVHRDGSALIARRSELDEWVRNGGGRRP